MGLEDASRCGGPDKQKVLGLLLLFIRGPLSLGCDVDFSTSVVFSWLNIRCKCLWGQEGAFGYLEKVRVLRKRLMLFLKWG